MTKHRLPIGWWDQENRLGRLTELYDLGMSDWEIAFKMRCTWRAVKRQRNILGLARGVIDDNPMPTPIAPIKFPRFEDITRAEARTILKDAPESATPTRESAYSETGCTAAWCMETKFD